MHDILISIVSHGQSRLANNLLSDLRRLTSDVDVLLTSNIAERGPILTIPNLRVVENAEVKGFGANHNAAFELSEHSYFCVSNPDIRLQEDPFAALRDTMNDPSVGLVAPLITDHFGTPEDSAREFPTPFALLKKAVGLGDGRLIVTGDSSATTVDWTAGMFMFFRAEAFKQIGGFDENFFLYYEDVDVCARLWQAGWKVAVNPTVSVIHEAQRSSHRDLRYARRHLASVLRYFLKHTGRLPKTRF